MAALAAHWAENGPEHRLLPRQITSTAVVSSSTASPSPVSSASTMSGFPDTKSKKSLVAKYVTEPLWNKLRKEETKTSGFTLSKAIACAVQFDNQHCGISAGDGDSILHGFRRCVRPSDPGVPRHLRGLQAHQRHGC